MPCTLSDQTTTYLLGIDTGGTYTDAVVFDESTSTVVAKAKTPTTHDDLEVCIRDVIGRVLTGSGLDAASISLVSLSTTLATNALVEGRGRPAGLVVIGFEPEVLDRGGIADALGPEPAIMIAGGHTPGGEEQDPLDLDSLAAQIDDVAERVDAFAVVGQFSVRNAGHELAAGELIRERTGLPVTASHELSSRINGPKRAVTALLNARLVALIDELIVTTETILGEFGIDAGVMVVRGDGSLVSADFVRGRPIETILSGPAASMVGAGHLADEVDALVADIGGTTTDIAVLVDGQPEFGDDGATVGGHATMVPAVRMDIWGLGGDSEIRQSDRSDGPDLSVGPQRAIPLSVLAATEPNVVQTMLERQVARSVPGPLDGVLIVPAGGDRVIALERDEQELMDRIGTEATPADRVLLRQIHHRVLDRLVAKGAVRRSSFTPTDACHVKGTQKDFDVTAARLGAELLARRRDRLGMPIAATPDEAADLVIEALARRSAEALLSTTLDRDGLSGGVVGSALAQAALDRRATSTGSTRPFTEFSIGLNRPIVALGASAAVHYPAVAALLGTRAVIPADADVANAIGAVVGRVRLTRLVTITAPRKGSFRIHAGSDVETVFDLDEAKAIAENHLAALLDADMTAAGAPVYESAVDWAEKRVELDGSDLFVEGTVTMITTGRPSLR